jgi:hypothetical protein
MRDKGSLESATGCFETVVKTKPCDEGVLYMIDASAQTHANFMCVQPRSEKREMA